MTGAVGPMGPSGAAGAAIPGALIYMPEGQQPPAGYRLIGFFFQEYRVPRAARPGRPNDDQDDRGARQVRMRVNIFTSP